MKFSVLAVILAMSASCASARNSAVTMSPPEKGNHPDGSNDTLLYVDIELIDLIHALKLSGSILRRDEILTISDGQTKFTLAVKDHPEYHFQLHEGENWILIQNPPVGLTLSVRMVGYYFQIFGWNRIDQINKVTNVPWKCDTRSIDTDSLIHQANVRDN